MKIRYYWVDIVKILACFFVIINHTLGYVFNFSGTNNYTVLFYSIFFPICKMGVPLFIMITGFLLLQKNNENTYKKTFWRIFRIFVPLFSISLLLFIKEKGISNFSILEFLSVFLTNPFLIYLWYLYMLIGLYLAIPFLSKMIKNFKDKDYVYFISIFLLFSSLLVFIKSVFDFNVSDYFTSAFIPIFLSLPVAGFYLSKVVVSKTKLFAAVFVFFLSFLSFFLYMYLNFLKYGEINFDLDSYNILLITMSLSFFYIIRYFGEKLDFKYILKNILKELGLLTFGIYLFHYLIAYRVYNLGIIQSIFEANYILGYGIMVITIFMLSGIVIFVCRKIPILKKFL